LFFAFGIMLVRLSRYWTPEVRGVSENSCAEEIRGIDDSNYTVNIQRRSLHLPSVSTWPSATAALHKHRLVQLNEITVIWYLKTTFKLRDCEHLTSTHIVVQQSKAKEV